MKGRCCYSIGAFEKELPSPGEQPFKSLHCPYFEALGSMGSGPHSATLFDENLIDN
jgi:hypothetical protein